MQIEQYECPESGGLIGEDAESCQECDEEFEYEQEETPEVGPKEVPDEEDTSTPAEEEAIPNEPYASRGQPLSLVGMTFAVLAVVCMVGISVVLFYDTWIDGKQEIHVGDAQVISVYLAVVAMAVCTVVPVVDLVRNGGKSPP